MDLIAEAANVGMVPVGPLRLEASNPTIKWRDKKYTFAWLALPESGFDSPIVSPKERNLEPTRLRQSLLRLRLCPRSVRPTFSVVVTEKSKRTGGHAATLWYRRLTVLPQREGMACECQRQLPAVQGGIVDRAN